MESGNGRYYFAGGLERALLMAGSFGDRAAVAFQPLPEGTERPRIARSVKEREQMAKIALRVAGNGTVKITQYFE